MSTSQALQEELRVRTTPRIERLKKRFYSDQFVVDAQRALLVTKSYQETEGQPIEIRRARALEEVLRHIDIHILDDELIVGCQTGSSPRGANVFPEMATYWIERELDDFETRPQDKFVITEETKANLRSIFPYWKGKTLHDHMVAQMPADTLGQLTHEHPTVFGWCAFQNGVGHVVQDHAGVIAKGFARIREEAQEVLEALDLTRYEDLQKEAFLRAVIIVSNAFIQFGRRYAAEARRLASIEADPQRIAELQRIGEVCEHVPEFPARNFYEAVQFLWFVELVTQIETSGVSISPGRFDQYLFPYFDRDTRLGIATRDESLEIIECLWIKLSEMVILYDKITASFIANFSMGEHIILGGQDADGADATNELSFLCLQAQMDVGLIQPNLSVRAHKGMDRRFLLEALRVVREKNAMPQLLNDELIIPSIVQRGISVEKARCYAADGCDEMSIAGEMGGQMFVYINLAKVFELALNGGRCRICCEQIGPNTGDPRQFASVEDIWSAYREQLKFAYHHGAITLNTEAMVHSKIMPVPFLSATLKNCVNKGQDMTAGGANYYWTSMVAIAGMSNVGDSLAAITKLVFEERKLSMTELINALDKNFQGFEPIRQMLIHKAPKFGNDIASVDELTVKAVDLSYEESQKYRDPRDKGLSSSIWPAYLTVTAHVQFGLGVGATPDGRQATMPLNDGISPVQGMDTHGPTAAMNSVAKLHLLQATGGMIYNMKFSPDSLATEENLNRLANLIEVFFFEENGGQVQFNITSTETLLDAQANPEKHRNLMVRVVGYSALFVELSKAVQDDLIRRTQYTGYQ